MFLVEASRNFSFAIVAKVNLDREGAEFTQHLFSLVRWHVPHVFVFLFPLLVAQFLIIHLSFD
jgi:hypothetical protein